MECPVCKARINTPDAMFCHVCGANLQQAAPPPSMGQAPVPPPNMGQPASAQMQYSNPAQASGPMYQQQHVPPNQAAIPPQRMKKKNSGMSIAAFITSLLGCLGIVGLILGIIDLVKGKPDKKHGLSIAAVIIGTIMLIFTFIAASGNSNYSSDTANRGAAESVDSSAPNNSTVPATAEEVVEEPIEETPVAPEPEAISDPAISKDEFIASCIPFPFKDVARNPENYIGQNFSYTAYISSAREGGLFTGYQKYYITYPFNLDEAYEWIEKGYADDLEDAKYIGMNSEISVWVLDNRDSSDRDYLKVLENDIVEIYGTFTGMQETKNSLNNSRSEELSLDIKFADLISD